MKLCYSATSPFVRKVMICAYELGLEDRIEKLNPDVSDRSVGINPATPLGKVPSLALDDGRVIFDSVVICEYLDSLSDKAALFPASTDARISVLVQHAIADGLTSACYNRRMDSAAPEGEGSPSMRARMKVAMEKCLDELESQAGTLAGRVDIATIAIAAALGYHDFRFGHENWREARPKLTGWHDEFSKRPSVANTEPPADG